MLKGYKTLIVNGLIVVGVALLNYLGTPAVSSALQSHPELALGVTAAANIGLRFLTTSPVGSKA